MHDIVGCLHRASGTFVHPSMGSGWHPINDIRILTVLYECRFESFS